MSALASLTDLKADAKLPGDASDDKLTRALADASAIAARVTGVPSLERASKTLTPWDASTSDGRTPVLRLPAPIESVSSIKQRYSLSTSMDDVDALTADTDYRIERDSSGQVGGSGRIRRINANWMCGIEGLIEVAGVFGYDDPGSPVGGDAILPPDDLQKGVIEQAIWLVRRGSMIGTNSINLGQGGAASFKDMEVVESLKQAASALPFVRII